jgi:hypothetical protein
MVVPDIGEGDGTAPTARSGSASFDLGDSLRCLVIMRQSFDILCQIWLGVDKP